MNLGYKQLQNTLKQPLNTLNIQLLTPLFFIN